MTLRMFYDFEFSEGFFKPISWLPSIFGFNKKQWSIELISIGIKCEDGRRYFAVNENYRQSRCNKWVRENVIPKLPPLISEIRHEPAMSFDEQPSFFPIKNLQYKPISEIRKDILNFTKGIKPILYGYYSDYDHVLLCTIFGTMMELPKNFPLYTIDLKQEFDNQVRRLAEAQHAGDIIQVSDDTFDDTMEEISEGLKSMYDYPKQGDDEHDALADAEFNHKLFKFIQKLEKTKTF